MFDPEFFRRQSLGRLSKPQMALAWASGTFSLTQARRAYDDFKAAEILVPLSAAAAIAAYGFYLRLW